MPVAWRGIAAAAVSGALSYASCFVGNGVGTDWGAGLWFGALVLAPGARGPGRRALLVALSVAVYRAAVWMAQGLYVDVSWPAVTSCALAGAAGALALPPGASALLGARAGGRAVALGTACGAGAGVLIGASVVAPDESLVQKLLLLAGFVAWQVGYAAAHRLRPWSGSAA
jgi:hypothetical protein